uniref:Uncharacterized protein n=1 Tax=Anguilla anguilla TaxID=7936 RepID=A0A0E9QQU6_ANGAN
MYVKSSVSSSLSSLCVSFSSVISCSCIASLLSESLLMSFVSLKLFIHSSLK